MNFFASNLFRVVVCGKSIIALIGIYFLVFLLNYMYISLNAGQGLNSRSHFEYSNLKFMMQITELCSES